ncbi:hypothetical protein GMJAKD_15285 [Candidatus Electrothrix aarhusensis]
MSINGGGGGKNYRTIDIDECIKDVVWFIQRQRPYKKRDIPKKSAILMLDIIKHKKEKSINR